MFNSSFNLYKTEWLDLVFANRNKNYGAYVLRKESSSILVKSMALCSAFFILLFVAPFVYSKLHPAAVTEVPKVTEFSAVDRIHEMKKNTPEQKKQEPEKSSPAKKIKTVAMSSNIVVTDDAKTPPPTLNEIKDAVVSQITQDGAIDPNAVVDSKKTVEGGTGAGNTDKDEGAGNNEILDVNAGGVDEFPEFIGGMKGFTKYIQKNLRFPSAAQEAEVQGKVFISFVVEKDGSISNVSLLRGIGFGCDEEALKVIKKSPLWKPGRNRGIPVRVRYNVPINFTIAQ